MKRKKRIIIFCKNHNYKFFFAIASSDSPTRIWQGLSKDRKKYFKRIKIDFLLPKRENAITLVGFRANSKNPAALNVIQNDGLMLLIRGVLY
ncbi:MAG TPA: hypothetical protein VGK06_04215 [Methanosarcina sp.]